MKPDLHGQKAGASKEKDTKANGRIEAQNGKPKQVKLKSKNMKSPPSNLSKMKSPSPVKSYAKEVNGNSTTKKPKKKNSDSVSTKEDKSRKRKREKEQNKPKSNSIANEEAKRRKGDIVKAKNSNSETEQKSMNVKLKKPKTAGAKTTSRNPSTSMGSKPSKSSVTVNKSSKSENGVKKKLKENGTDKKLKPSSPISKPTTSTKRNDSFSRKEEPGASKRKGQTKIAIQKKSGSISHANGVKIHPSKKDVKKKVSKATGHESSTASVEQSNVLSSRLIKVMRALGLAPPVGSPFIRQGTFL